MHKGRRSIPWSEYLTRSAGVASTDIVSHWFSPCLEPASRDVVRFVAFSCFPRQGQPGSNASGLVPIKCVHEWGYLRFDALAEAIKTGFRKIQRLHSITRMTKDGTRFCLR